MDDLAERQFIIYLYIFCYNLFPKYKLLTAQYYFHCYYIGYNELR